ncbi:MAG TPA: TonB-dependent receptor [Terriglobales bacterium]|nr:TonB-dependent receptor [Terriglobales bacterium]
MNVHSLAHTIFRHGGQSRKKLLTAVFLMAFSLVTAQSSWAQNSSSTGAVRGVVEDSTGAVVEGAVVKLSNRATSYTRETKTLRDGVYSFPLVPPVAAYQLVVEKAGFGKVSLTDIEVSVSDTSVVNVKLAVGTTNQEVAVSAEVQGVETTSATLGGVVGSRVLTALPLPTRNVFDLAATDAGVYAPLISPAATVAQGGNAIYVAGQRATNNDYRLNGVESTNVEFHTLANGAIPIPNPDAVQEFRTQTSLYDASSAYGSGGNINLITRSGSTSYHGVVYDFIRNTALNANDYFLKYAQAHPVTGSPTNQAPIMIQNQFGGSLGGPIPKVKNTFFFVNYEGARQKNGSTGFVSGQIPVLPATRDAASLAAAFNLPVSRIDPVAVRLLNARGPLGGYLFPSVAGTPGTLGLYSASGPVLYNTNQLSSRLDRDFKLASRDNHLGISFFYQNGLFINPSGLSSSPGQAYDYPLGNQNLSIIDTHTISNRVINQAVIGYNWVQRDIEAYGDGVRLADVGMSRFNSSYFPTLPSFSFTDGSLGEFGYGGNIGRYQHTATINFHDTVSWSLNKHMLRFGFETIREQFNESPQASPGGSLNFNTVFANQIPGYALASTSPYNLSLRDFLIGAPYTTSGNTGKQRFHLRDANYSGFVQDDFRATRRLMLNLGLRYDYFGNPTETNNLISNFDPSLLSAATIQSGGPGLQQGFLLANVNGTSASTLLSNKGNISPRVGFAYDLFGDAKVAIRGGFGLYYQSTNTMQSQLINNPPFYLTATQTNTAVTGLSDPFAILGLPQPSAFPLYPTFQTLTGVNATTGAPIYSSGSPVTVRGVQRNNKTPYAENWNLTAEYGFLPHWVLSLGYLGSNGVRQSAGLSLNNALLVNATNPGRFGLTRNSAANRESRVPIAGLSTTGYSTIVNEAFSSYNALLVTVTHNISKNFLFKGAYTFSKSINNFPASESTASGGSSQVGNQFSLALNKGISEQDIPHRFVATYVWDLPGFRNSKANFILGHWSLSGITTYQSGLPGVITQSIGSASLTGTSGYGIVTGDLRNPGSPQSNFSAGKIQYLNPASVTTQTRLGPGASIGPTSPQLTPGTEFYTIATNSGATGTVIGNSTRGAFRAPYQNRWDVTLSKRFPLAILGEAGNVEFRTEAFKVFNNAIFDTPNATAGSSAFGQITKTTDSTGRQLQFALKVSF